MRDYAYPQALAAVALIGAVFVLGPHLHVGDVRQVDALAIGGGLHRQGTKILGAVVETGDLHRHGHAVVADLPPGQLDVLPLEGILHVGDRDGAGRHVGGAQPHIHDLSQVTGEGHLAHPVHQA